MNLRLAFHESGHACVALAFGIDVQFATIEPDKDSFGYVFFRKWVDADPEKLIVTFLAGAAAEAAFARRQGVVFLEDHCLNDSEKAQTLIDLCDVSPKSIREWRKRAEEVVAAEWAWISATAETLAWHGHLSATEIMELRGTRDEARCTD